MKKLSIILSLLVVSMLASQDLMAQRVSLMANFSSFDIDQVSNGSTEIDYAGSTSLTANLRLFNDRHWAVRVGAGVDNLNYHVSDGVTTDYQAQRQDLKGILGLEKHFQIGDFMDIYPGAYVPIIIVGEEKIQANYDNITNGGVRSGLGVVLGANIRLFRIMRVGVEFDASYDAFRQTVWESVDQTSLVPFSGINHTTAFTVGFAF